MSGQLDYSIILEHLRSLFSVYHIAGCTLHVTHLNVICQIELTACHNILLFICLQTLAVNKKVPSSRQRFDPLNMEREKNAVVFSSTHKRCPTRHHYSCQVTTNHTFFMHDNVLCLASRFVFACTTAVNDGAREGKRSGLSLDWKDESDMSVCAYSAKETSPIIATHSLEASNGIKTS